MTTHDTLTVLSSIPLTNDTIIYGDLNSRLGSLTDDYATNTQGFALCQWLEECALTVVNGQLSPCIPTFISFCQNVEISSIIDLFLTNMSLTNTILNIHTNLSLNSDHCLLSLSFTYAINSTSHAPLLSCKTWNLSHLKEPDVLKLYAHTFVTNFANLKSTLQSTFKHSPFSRPPIYTLTDEFNSLIYNSLSSSIDNFLPVLPTGKNSGIQHSKQLQSTTISATRNGAMHVAYTESIGEINILKHRQISNINNLNDDINLSMCFNTVMNQQQQQQLCRPPPPHLHSISLPFASANLPFVSFVVEECMQFMPNQNF
ncbi:hypothetical protein PHYBLDRAFT_153851 [Phycomyces blakesleeanus NRRL 1555(-)]|uniref:Endonuclease/exonuclease/phosphatase domain-containing protein n=1 Tax=Phycomyces blakesleeanus (strain ATCC 8743b / DSM 1359 / FGSC 10004 / NBRC 33097 / NRRL 1555) TaxID=763407 RepID=A0A162SZG3_PHYB8|nr:hypothetical protein PHYBLDRAFT_153851 [Phycomyces blakesleeanus NRRL 1555(-)]OAD65042.1 hypothetical protein PHYBLDRAFT_153851 [Phycomyces blakesleeanus NRRL 1555(-)]|eukprot:XP_018283082.1 hypothetical protein PHYBLDRAFT_153851 [Phycomyces blakesleeanus NRRL 1555(-)]